MASQSKKSPSKKGSVHLEDLKYPPSEDELSRFRDNSNVPRPFKRADGERVFCNRNVNFKDVKVIGFDMDFTLAVYKEEIDVLTFRLVVQRLVDVGYPSDILKFEFDPNFAERGLFFDKEFGNLIKCDGFGNIMFAFHGRKSLTRDEISDLYPSAFVPSQDIGDRMFVMNTLFNMPEICLYADLIEFFTQLDGFSTLEDGRGVRNDSTLLTWQSLFEDVRSAVDWVHFKGDLKRTIEREPETYVHKNPDLPVLLDRLRSSGRKVFLATNSDYPYTQKIMTYLFQDVDKDWKSYFDLVVVSTKKPTFFDCGTALREVDQESGALKLGHYVGDDFSGCVFAGGSASIVMDMLGATGSEVLYVGDHVFGDVLKSKKLRAWKTMLIIPELADEVKALRQSEESRLHLRNLEFMLAEAYRGLQSDASEEPDTKPLAKDIEKTVREINNCFNPHFGSIFKAGSAQSFFAMQTSRFADLYAGSCTNLIYYPLFYQFRAAGDSLPHEILQQAKKS